MAEDLLGTLEQTAAQARSALSAVSSIDSLEAVEIEYLGRKGSLTLLLRQIGELPREARGAFGKLANERKREIELVLEERRRALAAERLVGARDFDPSTPGVPGPLGHRHPVLSMRRELEDVFLSMGFRVLDGPEVESEYYNFDALNVPDWHPARDTQDTFWVKSPGAERWVLRTQTSPMQVRAMQQYGAPLRAVVPGRVYRNETCDATHESAFHQVEGIVVDRGISVAHLKGVIRALLGQVFGRDVDVRLRPHFFPFVEPGFELDFRCVLCGGSGCSLCKRTGWIEMLGCGMVHASVLRAGGIDPEEFTGFAFGLGLDRLVMMRHAIEDIRHFHGGSLRFLEQF